MSDRPDISFAIMATSSSSSSSSSMGTTIESLIDDQLNLLKNERSNLAESLTSMRSNTKALIDIAKRADVSNLTSILEYEGKRQTKADLANGYLNEIDNDILALKGLLRKRPRPSESPVDDEPPQAVRRIIDQVNLNRQMRAVRSQLTVFGPNTSTYEVLSAEQKRIEEAQISSLTTTAQSPQPLPSPSSMYGITVPYNKVDAKMAWRTMVIDKGVSCEITSVEAILPAEVPLLADLRWLQYYLKERGSSLKPLTSKQSHLERRYHPFMLSVYQAAAFGLQYVRFDMEDASAAQPIEDVRCLIGSHRMEPQECKAASCPTVRQSIQATLDANDAALGQLLKCCIWMCGQDSARHGPEPFVRTIVCSFTYRIQLIWFVEYRLRVSNNGQVVDVLSCRVTSGFPSQSDVMNPLKLDAMRNTLVPLHGLKAEDPPSELGAILPLAPTEGFRTAVRYSEHLASVHKPLALASGLVPASSSTSSSSLSNAGEQAASAMATSAYIYQPQTRVILLREDRTSDGLDTSSAVVLAHGRRSIVVQLRLADNFVVKISPSMCIDQEVSIHRTIDYSPTNQRNCTYLRAMRHNGYGQVDEQTAGPGLGFVELEGVGDPLAAIHFSKLNLVTARWQEAVAALDTMHKLCVLHRDIKPSNMLIIDGHLVLNDFDMSCSMDSEDILCLHRGTPAYHSPLLSEPWERRDDWLSLALSFIALHFNTHQRSEPFRDWGGRRDALMLACSASWSRWIPADMKRTIEMCLLENRFVGALSDHPDEERLDSNGVLVALPPPPMATTASTTTSTVTVSSLYE